MTAAVQQLDRLSGIESLTKPEMEAEVQRVREQYENITSSSPGYQEASEDADVTLHVDKPIFPALKKFLDETILNRAAPDVFDEAPAVKTRLDALEKKYSTSTQVTGTPTRRGAAQ